MAGALDLARHTRRIRAEQQQRNLAALKEQEARRSDAERLGKMSPSQIRREQLAARKQQQSGPVIGHRAGTVEDKMQGPGSYEDKMDRGGEDKDDPEEQVETQEVEQTEDETSEVQFASPAARKLADDEFGIPHSVLADFVPSSKLGFTADDIRAIKQALDAEDEDEEEGEG